MPSQIVIGKSHKRYAGTDAQREQAQRQISTYAHRLNADRASADERRHREAVLSLVEQPDHVAELDNFIEHAHRLVDCRLYEAGMC